jgi:hypothetical protein
LRVSVATSVLLLITTASAVAAATGPPSPASASRAFGSWLHDHYGNVQGYRTCPRAQSFGNEISCLAEVRVGKTWHLISADARLSGGHVVFPRHFDKRWARHWSPYTRLYLEKGGFTLPGRVSVNGPAFDWAWLALGAHDKWKHHRVFHLQGYDGHWTGFERIFDFTCTVRQNLVSCRNVFGDAMRYIPG